VPSSQRQPRTTFIGGTFGEAPDPLDEAPRLLLKIEYPIGFGRRFVATPTFGRAEGLMRAAECRTETSEDAELVARSGTAAKN